MRRSTLFLSCLVSAAPVALATPAAAQDAAATAAPEPVQTAQNDAEANPGDIIVTATRRAQALSDVPIAISAVSGQTLQNTGATDVRALNLQGDAIVDGQVRRVGTGGQVMVCKLPRVDTRGAAASRACSQRT